MAEILLSEAEKTFILHGVEEGFRCDGRMRLDYRPMEVETDVVSHASGSARLRLANTDILVGVKTEIDTPYPERPREGKIEFFVDCSANATPAFEGRGGEELGTEISNSLATAYQSSQTFDLTALCILPGQQCWKLYIDILILECGGNLFDAVSLAVKAALHNTRVPKVKGACLDGGTVDLQLSDDPYDCCRLDVSDAPCLVTLCKIGDHCVVDPTAEEETCSSGSVVIAITEKSLVTSVFKTGVGSFHPQTLIDILKVGQTIGLSVNKALRAALLEEEQQGRKKECFGFLK
ncbi:Exosome complex component RRP42 [Cryptotermes secundus]|uniref:Ribosomal RNA-processing protein 42 n=2 Tax=Cryptotermes secundus TaxID=105785 RepID=A0A2J7R2R5_9NEOP|nr:exosome complex component RRP42 isoform X1 [Cryptotermes secundus]PNF35123.1 Exosome complex component RRP42 [Cryptotermes secundus]PNF35124.1 Exosome complex component RRP42 [Cryptotermes secundus]